MELRFDRSSSTTTTCRADRLRAIPGLAAGGRDFSCCGVLCSAQIRIAWWAQPDHKRPLGAWGGPDPSIVQMGEKKEELGHHQQTQMPKFQPWLLALNPVLCPKKSSFLMSLDLFPDL